ncbi:hypothetical protein V9T40_012609 [Parthenolecanium corni]|uniref:SPRY domain-containing SOCS box protein 3 n=1 Tax=Parthenolecanium corni TaxID=536013 RepID=A0AAN9TBF6_9HEMI
MSENDAVKVSQSVRISPFTQPINDNWTWNPKCKSCDAHCQENNKSVLFHPVWSCGTSAIRGTKVLNNARSYWEIIVTGGLGGTSLMFGVGTCKSRLGTAGFTNLIGEDCNSWGLSHKGLLWHAGKCQKYCRPFPETKQATIGILFDGIYGTLTFFKDGENLGMAFQDLDKVNEPLYPIVSSTSMRSRMTLKRMEYEFVSLQDQCKAIILKNLHHQGIQYLNLPFGIRRYLEESDTQNRPDECEWYVPRF